MKICVEKLSENEFARSRLPWDEIRRISKVDALFMSWSWQYRWWVVFGKKLGLELQILVAKNEEGRIVGILPLTSGDFKNRLVSLRRIDLLGNLLFENTAVRSEYLEPIIHPDAREEVVYGFVKFISTYVEHDEVVFKDSPLGSEVIESFGEKMRVNSYLRPLLVAPQNQTVVIDLTRGWDNYLSSLGKGTRSRLFGRRRFLESRHNVKFQYVNRDFADVLESMIRLHKSRWNGQLFDELQKQFHVAISEQYAKEGLLRLSTLSVDDRLVSVLYCIRAEDRVYNIQAGFDQNCYPGKISLGMLHLGYEVEASVREGVKKFDLLAGGGRSTLYKFRLATQGTQLTTFHWIRNSKIASLYKLKDWINAKRQKSTYVNVNS